MPRGPQIRQERRRRNTDALSGKRRRLAVNEAMLDRDAYEYRWINDEGNRIFNLTKQDDWDIVPNTDGQVKPDGTGMGAETATPVGTGERGAPLRAVLVRKPKALFDEDVQAQQRRIDETEAGLRRGAVSGVEQEKSYVPGSQGISITHRDNA